MWRISENTLTLLPDISIMQDRFLRLARLVQTQISPSVQIQTLKALLQPKPHRYLFDFDSTLRLRCYPPGAGSHMSYRLPEMEITTITNLAKRWIIRIQPILSNCLISNHPPFTYIAIFARSLPHFRLPPPVAWIFQNRHVPTLNHPMPTDFRDPKSMLHLHSFHLNRPVLTRNHPMPTDLCYSKAMFHLPSADTKSPHAAHILRLKVAATPSRV